ncbi:ATP-binding protein [Luedemannella flava]
MAAGACTRCGRTAGPEDRFCGWCGTALMLVCDRCGKGHAVEIAFCTGCGHALRESATPPVAAEERRRVSVLFIDAVGSTTLAEHTDPETVRRIQTAFFDTVRRTVRQFGGVVEKFIGDAAMVLFGAPVATETDAVRCVRAGLNLQRDLAASEETNAWQYRVGIATGDALVDVAVAHDGGQAIVAGDVVNTAARLQSEAPVGGVLVCGVTHVASRTDIRYSAQAARTLKGRSAPTEVWLALGPVQQQIDPATDTTEMVGREHELSVLTTALHHVVAERTPRMVTVLGRAGIGKSRLVRELYRHTDQTPGRTICWRKGRCPPFGENVGYAALADIVRAQAGVLDTDPPEVARQRLDTALRDLVEPGECDRLSDALRPLLGLPGSPLSTEDAESAWRQFLLALGAAGPTVLVFEDVHWADERMLRFIELLGASVRDVPLLMICTARPELLDRAPGWSGALPGMISLSLTPLRDESIARLYSQMLGAAAFPAALLRPLVELADGMPLYAQEYVRMLIERGTLRQADSSWVMDPGAGLPMPDSVHAVIANRIDLLDSADRTALQAAAVVGTRFWPGAVAAALGTGVDGVERALRGLAQRDLVREEPTSRMAGEVEYRFRHSLVGEVCYERLPRAERVARHTRTADWLDAHADPRGTELAELVAHHRYTAYRTAAELGQPTAPYAVSALAALRHAARRAVTVNAFDAAAADLTRAEQLVDSGTAESDRLGVELLRTELAFHSEEAAFVTGPGPDRLHELADRLYRVGEHTGAARAWTLLGQAAWLGGDRTAALRHLDRAVELFDAAPNSPEKAHALAEVARLHMLNYEHVPALAAAGMALEIADELGLVEVRANASITIGMCHYQAGTRGGLAHLVDAMEFCRTHQVPSLRRATRSVALAWWEEGEIERAIQLLGPVSSLGEAAWEALGAGDWPRFLAATDAYLPDSQLARTEAGRSARLTAARAAVRALRGERAAADDAAHAVAVARASGAWRRVWPALAHAALAWSALGHDKEALEALTELGDGWRGPRVLASRQWVPAAAHAASLLGAAGAELVRGLILQVPRHTPWSRAALASLAGTVAGGGPTATRHHLDAARRYGDLRSATDRALALRAAARAGTDITADLLADLTAFRTANGLADC